MILWLNESFCKYESLNFLCIDSLHAELYWILPTRKQKNKLSVWLAWWVCRSMYKVSVVCIEDTQQMVHIKILCARGIIRSSSYNILCIWILFCPNLNCRPKSGMKHLWSRTINKKMILYSTWLQSRQHMLEYARDCCLKLNSHRGAACTEDKHVDKMKNPIKASKYCTTNPA